MARERSPNRKKAFEIYKEHNGRITNREIAKILEISEKTIAGWKSKDKWSTPKNMEYSEKTTPKEKNIKKQTKESIVDEVKEVVENEELTDKQRLFCVIYSQCMNATKAYLKAYQCTYETAMVNGPRLLGNARVKTQLDSLIAAKCNKEYLQRSVIQKYIDIAFSDIGDYVQFGKKYEKQWINKDGVNVPVIDPETGEQKTIEYNYLDLKESSMVDTTLISEVSEGKDGIKFKLLDKMKALDFLTKHCNLLSDEEKVQLEIENKKLQNEKLRNEIKNQIGDTSSEGVQDFLRAVNPSEEDIKALFEGEEDGQE